MCGWALAPLDRKSQKKHRAGGAVFLNCPRCGLSIRRRVDWLHVEHCPRCIGRAGIAVKLFVSARPSPEWYRDGPTADAAQAEGTTTRPGRSK